MRVRNILGSFNVLLGSHVSEINGASHPEQAIKTGWLIFGIHFPHFR